MATQVEHPRRAVVRTVFQVVIALAAALPLIVVASGVPATAAGVGVALAVAAGVTRVMALPVVNDLIDQYVPWLRTE
ncbi:hypothetical protein L3Y25_gp036 [Gordonia phage Syleon]|nr:holin [Gordonia Phage Sephiroth]YP_010246554.1 holin [Gordonia phage Kudefre]YP_010246695.1 hypothetical protein L3Y25_gp036 [Gordonia phage Syleon]QGH75765.1 hypothetical protein SEA_SYLEON_36 [Gordonia phage Syleon]QNN99380.1 hypothetical protein SEA_SEPHIROTH_36 [Gordonia Phage Sephiroth]UDL15269.1 hypothetical protein SEA_KUDEFRE_35 [Gordonia phage Kudefre]